MTCLGNFFFSSLKSNVWSPRKAKRHLSAYKCKQKAAVSLKAGIWCKTGSNSCSKGKGKGKAVPLQAWTGPDGSRRSRLPDF
jgi:hypothetical protein